MVLIVIQIILVDCHELLEHFQQQEVLLVQIEVLEKLVLQVPHLEQTVQLEVIVMLQTRTAYLVPLENTLL